MQNLLISKNIFLIFVFPFSHNFEKELNELQNQNEFLINKNKSINEMYDQVQNENKSLKDQLMNTNKSL